jgi:hypothetical protein
MGNITESSMFLDDYDNIFDDFEQSFSEHIRNNSEYSNLLSENKFENQINQFKESDMKIIITNEY